MTKEQKFKIKDYAEKFLNYILSNLYDYDFSPKGYHLGSVDRIKGFDAYHTIMYISLFYDKNSGLEATDLDYATFTNAIQDWAKNFIDNNIYPYPIRGKKIKVEVYIDKDYWFDDKQSDIFVFIEVRFMESSL